MQLDVRRDIGGNIDDEDVCTHREVPGSETILTGRSLGMTPVLNKRDISHLWRQQRLLSSAGETIVKNVDIGITAATVSPIEDNCGGRRQCEDQRKPLQVVLAVLVQAMRLQAPEMRL